MAAMIMGGRTTDEKKRNKRKREADERISGARFHHNSRQLLP